MSALRGKTMTTSDETAIVLVENMDMPMGYINRDLVTQMGDTLMSIHPAAKEVGEVGMRAVAQLALLTGASPMPGTNGIHAWVDNKGKTCIQFGIGFWRGEAEKAGGVLWDIRPRPMTSQEREAWGVSANEKASYCKAAMKKDAYELMGTMRGMGIQMSLKDAIWQVAVEGVGVCSSEKWANGGGYKDAKNGRPLQWTADERAERDILRKLVPILQRMREPIDHPTGGMGWAVSDFARPAYKPNQITDGQDRKQNAALFDNSSEDLAIDGEYADDEHEEEPEEEPEEVLPLFAIGDEVVVHGEKEEKPGVVKGFHENGKVHVMVEKRWLWLSPSRLTKVPASDAHGAAVGGAYAE